MASKKKNNLILVMVHSHVTEDQSSVKRKVFRFRLKVLLDAERRSLR